MSLAAPTEEMSPRAFLITGATIVTFTSIFVVARIGANARYTKRLVASDYFAFVAVIFLAASLTVNYLTVKALVTPTTNLFEIQELGIAIGVVTGASMWTSKVPILLLYIRVFSVEKWFKIVCYGILATTGLVMILGATVPICPPQHTIGLMHLAHCAKKSSIAGVVVGSVAVISDVLILLLPLRPLFRMQLPSKKKIGLILVFLTGIFAIIASAVSLHYKTLSLRGSSADMTIAMLCTVMECCIAIIVSCTPAIYCFGSHFAKSGIYLAIRSAFSRASLSSRSTRSQAPRNSSASRMNGNSRNQYANLEEDGISMKNLIPGATMDVEARR